MGNDEPKIKTVPELYIYVKGEFKNINNKLSLVFWIGGLAGAICSALIVGVFKLLGG